uniref:Uncharacterized protein n=1 Tax=Romanomermis culicivorax TaxID=13658 RepID=A0A915J578_ROMCU
MDGDVTEPAEPTARGRPKKCLMDCIDEDMRKVGTVPEDAQDRAKHKYGPTLCISQHFWKF